MKKNESKTESRRKFLKTAGIFAVYTPPALMIMSQANANEFAKSNGGVHECTGEWTSDSNCPD